MPRYLLIALNGPTNGPGDEETYNDWYDEVHIPDLVSLSAVRSARRYKVVANKRADWPYAAVYEVETGDIAAVMRELETKPRRFTPTFDRSKSAFVLAMEIGS